jgi:hypothetical protein
MKEINCKEKMKLNYRQMLLKIWVALNVSNRPVTLMENGIKMV